MKTGQLAHKSVRTTGGFLIGFGKPKSPPSQLCNPPMTITHLDHDGRRQHDSEFVKLTMNAVRLNVKLANQLEFWQSVTLIAIAKLTSLLAFTLKALLEQFEFLLKVSEPTIRFDPEPARHRSSTGQQFNQTHPR
jgi:hypothetical protein